MMGWRTCLIAPLPPLTNRLLDNHTDSLTGRSGAACGGTQSKGAPPGG